MDAASLETRGFRQEAEATAPATTHMAASNAVAVERKKNTSSSVLVEEGIHEHLECDVRIFV